MSPRTLGETSGFGGSTPQGPWGVTSVVSAMAGDPPVFWDAPPPHHPRAGSSYCPNCAAKSYLGVPITHGKQKSICPSCFEMAPQLPWQQTAACLIIPSPAALSLCPSLYPTPFPSAHLRLQSLTLLIPITSPHLVLVHGDIHERGSHFQEDPESLVACPIPPHAYPLWEMTRRVSHSPPAILHPLSITATGDQILKWHLRLCHYPQDVEQAAQEEGSPHFHGRPSERWFLWRDSQEGRQGAASLLPRSPGHLLLLLFLPGSRQEAPKFPSFSSFLCL